MKALVLSQVILSFILPVTIIHMLLIKRRKDLMGFLVNKHFLTLNVIVLQIILFYNYIIDYEITTIQKDDIIMNTKTLVGLYPLWKMYEFLS